MGEPVMAASIERKLQQRLEEWARDYLTPFRIDWQDRNILQTLIEHGGFVPGSGGVRATKDRTPADEVEDIVLSMARSGLTLYAAILRIEHRRPSMPMEQRLQVIRRAGANLSRPNYYNKLAKAEAFVAGALFGACV